MLKNDQVSTRRASFGERMVEATISGSRWLLVPFHFGLLVAVITLLVKFAEVAFSTLTNVFALSGKDVIIASLSMIELALIANLLLMVIFSSYVGFVSRLDVPGEHKERLSWREELGFGVLKVRHRFSGSHFWSLPSRESQPRRRSKQLRHHVGRNGIRAVRRFGHSAGHYGAVFGS